MDSGIILTKEGYQRVLEELEHLKCVRRKEVAERIREAKQFGEFLENSEFEEAKAEQASVEGKIEELQHILQHARVVDQTCMEADLVGIGSLVKLRELASGQEFEYRIVGPIEADPAQNRISYQSPVGQALLGHREKDTVSVKAPNGSFQYLILQVTC